MYTLANDSAPDGRDWMDVLAVAGSSTEIVVVASPERGCTDNSIASPASSANASFGLRSSWHTPDACGAGRDSNINTPAGSAAAKHTAQRRALTMRAPWYRFGGTRSLLVQV